MLGNIDRGSVTVTIIFWREKINSFICLVFSSYSFYGDFLCLFWWCASVLRTPKQVKLSYEVLNLVRGGFYYLMFLRTGKDLAVPEYAREWFHPRPATLLAGRWSLRDSCQRKCKSEWPLGMTAPVKMLGSLSSLLSSAEPGRQWTWSIIFKVISYFSFGNCSSCRGESLAPHESCQT